MAHWEMINCTIRATHKFFLSFQSWNETTNDWTQRLFYYKCETVYLFKKKFYFIYKISKIKSYLLSYFWRIIEYNDFWWKYLYLWNESILFCIKIFFFESLNSYNYQMATKALRIFSFYFVHMISETNPLVEQTSPAA